MHLALLIAITFAQTLTADADGFHCLRATARTTTIATSLTEDVVIRDGVILVARGPRGLSVYTRDGREQATLALDARNLILDGDRVWVRGDGDGITLVDWSNPLALRPLRAYVKDPVLGPWLRMAPEAIVGRDGVLWVALQGWLDVYDVSDWQAPVLLAHHRHEAHVTSLELVGDLLLLHDLDQVRVWNVSEPKHPVPIGALSGRLLEDEGRWYLAGKSQLSRVEFQEDGAPSIQPLVTLGTLDRVVAVVGERLLVHHDTHTLSVLTLPGLELVGAVSGDFETGDGPTARWGDALYVSTRFGGLQRIGLTALASTPERRFKGHPLERNRYHGDLLTVPVGEGDSVARLIKRYGLEDPSATSWAKRIEPVRLANQSMLPDLAVVHAGDLVRLPLPRTLICRP